MDKKLNKWFFGFSIGVASFGLLMSVGSFVGQVTPSNSMFGTALFSVFSGSKSISTSTVYLQKYINNGDGTYTNIQNRETGYIYQNRYISDNNGHYTNIITGESGMLYQERYILLKDNTLSDVLTGKKIPRYTPNNLSTVIDATIGRPVQRYVVNGSGSMVDITTGSTTERYILDGDDMVKDIITGSSTPRYIINTNGTYLDTLTMQINNCGTSSTIGESNQSSSTKIWSCAQMNTSWDSAVSFCANLSENGKGWKLPTEAELISAFKSKTSNFAKDFYWTSASDGSKKAKYIDMVTGNKGSNLRIMVYHVRCIK